MRDSLNERLPLILSFETVFFFLFCVTEYFVAKMCLTAGMKACSCWFWLCVCVRTHVHSWWWLINHVHTQHFFNIPRVSCRSTVATNVNSLVLKAWWWIWNSRKYMNHEWRFHFHPCFSEESCPPLLSHRPTLLYQPPPSALHCWQAK